MCKGQLLRTRRKRKFPGLQLSDLFYSSLVSSRLGWGIQEDMHNPANLIFAQQIRSDADDIAVMMLPGASCGEFIMRQDGTDAGHLIRDDRHADAAAFQEDSDFALPDRDRVGRGGAVVGVIDIGASIAAKVGDFMPELGKHGLKSLFCFKPAMVAGQRNFHVISGAVGAGTCIT